MQAPFEDDKGGVVHDEVAEKREVGVGFAALEGNGIVKSPFDDLSIPRAAWVFRRACAYCFIAFTSSIMEGFMITISGAIIANQGFINQFGDVQSDGTKVLNTSWVSAWSAIINVGQIVAMTYTPYIADRYGRKYGFYIVWVLFLACILCLNFAKSPAVWLVGKLFVGIGIGSAQILVTPYAMEIAPTRVRGGIVAGGLIWTTIGGILCSLMLQITNKHFPLHYKLPVYVAWGPLGGLAICFLILPESPWFFARHGRKEESIKSMRRLYGNVANFDFDEEYAIIVRNLEHEAHQRGEGKGLNWSDVLRGLNLRRLMVMAVLCCAQQLGGLTLVSTYSTYFFQLAGLADPFLASLIQTCIGLGAVIVYTFTIDKLGRRYPICIAYTLMCLLCWMIGGIFYAGSGTSQRVLLALVCLWQPCFVVFGNSYFLIASELPTAQMRLKLNAASWVTQALLGVVTCFAVPPLLTHLGIRAAFVFGATSLPCVAFFWYFLPETKARSVAEIDELYERHVKAWKWSGFETEAERQMREAVAAQRV